MDKKLLVSLSFALMLAIFLLSPMTLRAQTNVVPASFSFGTVTVGTASPANTFTITAGPHPVSIQSVSSTAGQFMVVGSQTMPISLPPRGSATFQVVFQPAGAGSFAGNIVVSIQNRRNTNAISVAVSGTATAATAAIPPPPATTYLLSESGGNLSFPSTLVGTSSSQPVTLTNTGTGAVTISQAAVSGAGFTLVGFTGAVTLAAGNSVSLTVGFAPTATGSAAGTLSVASNATNSPAPITLSGTAVQPQISVVPSSVSFPSVTVGQTNTQTVTIQNVGTANLTVSQASVASSAFTYSGLTLPLSLAPGTSSAFTLAFKPAAAGSSSANLSLASNSPNSPSVVPLSGTSVASVQQLSASPTSLSFGNITTGTSSSQTVTLTNTGNASVSISSISVTGAGFSPTGFTLPLTLAAGQSTTFSLVFAPTNAGTISGSATVSSNASNSPQTIALAGTGAAPVSNSVLLSWTAGSPSAVAFNVYRGSQSGGPYTRVNPSSVSVTQYTDSSVSSGQTYYYVATELDSAGNESAYSGEWNCTVP